MPVLEHSPNNPEIALFYVNLLRQLRGPNPSENVRAAVAADMGGVTFSTYRADTVQRLGYWFGGNSRRQLLLIDGLRSDQQARNLIDGYAPSLGLMAAGNSNPWIRDQATRIYQEIGLANFQLSEHLDLVGYSAGGAVAVDMAAGFQSLPQFPIVKLSTFGAPRTGKENIRDGMAAVDMVRWMHAADPIPLVPLRLQDAPQIALLVPTTIVLAWSSFLHGPGGISIKPNGDMTPATLPSLASASPVGSVASWYWGIEDDPNNSHSLVAYFNALTAAVQASANVLQEEVPVGHGEQVDIPSRQEVTAQRKRSEAAIFTAASNQTAVNPEIPEYTLFLAYRQGRTWYVSFGDQTIIIAGPEKRARHIARAGNDFVRSLLKQACVSPETILGQFNAFMVLAQDPTSGFVPTLKTSLPE